MGLGSSCSSALDSWVGVRDIGWSHGKEPTGVMGNLGPELS